MSDQPPTPLGARALECETTQEPSVSATTIDAQTTRLRNAVEAVLGHQFASGNTIEVLKNGNEIFPSMLDAIARAEQTIEFVTFVYWTGDIARRFAQALGERARAGVRVRAVLDGFGSLPMDPDLIAEMRSAGVMVERFRPVVRWKFWESDHRTHRKILVIDNETAFTGGVGIAEEWMGNAANPSEWRDTHFRIDGPAVVGLRAAFLTDWRDIGHGIERSDILINPPSPVGGLDVAVVDGSAQIGYNDPERVLEALVAAADERIMIATPYFNPTDIFIDRLIEARHRSVDIDLLIPGPHIDKRISLIMARERYEPLVREGIRVWEYQRSMFHVKAVLVDHRLAMVGSVNINQRSVEKDEEVALVVLDHEMTETLEEHFQEDIAASHAASTDVRARRPLEKMAAKVLRPIRREL